MTGILTIAGLAAICAWIAYTLRHLNDPASRFLRFAAGFGAGAFGMALIIAAAAHLS